MEAALIIRNRGIDGDPEIREQIAVDAARDDGLYDRVDLRSGLLSVQGIIVIIVGIGVAACAGFDAADHLT